MKIRLAIPAIAALAVAVIPIGAGNVAEGADFLLRKRESGPYSTTNATKLRLHLANNDQNAGTVRIRLSWPSGRGDISSLIADAVGTWDEEADVVFTVSPQLNQPPSIDTTITGNVFRTLEVGDLFGQTTFTEGDLCEFLFQISGDGPFLMQLQPRTGGQTFLNNDFPPAEIAVDQTLGLNITPTSDPAILVVAKLLGTSVAVSDNFLDHNFDEVFDVADVLRVTGIAP